MKVMTREELHRLVDTLPQAALEPAEKTLQHFQVWPHRPPPKIEEMRQAHRERFLRSMRPGTSGTGGGGSYTDVRGGRVQSGRFSFSHWEQKTNVIETHHFHESHEITVTERPRMDDDGRTLVYANEILGPNGKTHRQEIAFEIA
jgi:hypothetical protein